MRGGLQIPLWSLPSDDVGHGSFKHVKRLVERWPGMTKWLMLPIGPLNVDARLVRLTTLLLTDQDKAVEYLGDVCIARKQVCAGEPFLMNRCPYIPLSAFALNPVYGDYAGSTGKIFEMEISTTSPVVDRLMDICHRTLDECVHTNELKHPRMFYERCNRFIVHYVKAMAEACWCFHQVYESNVKKQFDRWIAGESPPSSSFESWLWRCGEAWALDYAIFTALMRLQDVSESPTFPSPWQKWEEKYQRKGYAKSLMMFQALKPEPNFVLYVVFELFCQFIVEESLRTAKSDCLDGVQMIGDIPVYVPCDSCDCWANPEVFDFDNVSGLPPDYWTKTGQLWGTPVYRWGNPETVGWWDRRFLRNLELFDIVRIDHFRAFADFWAVTRENAELHKNGMHGKWVLGPGSAYFREFETRHALEFSTKVIVEDLGELTPALKTMLTELKDFRRMDVLHFQFEAIHEWVAAAPDPSERLRMLRSGEALGSFWIAKRSSDVPLTVFTSTHDDPTMLEWLKTTSDGMIDVINAVTGVGRVLLTQRNAQASVMITKRVTEMLANAHNIEVMTTPQDLMGIGAEGRINVPGQGPNPRLWSWIASSFS